MRRILALILIVFALFYTYYPVILEALRTILPILAALSIVAVVIAVLYGIYKAIDNHTPGTKPRYRNKRYYPRNRSNRVYDVESEIKDFIDKRLITIENEYIAPVSSNVDDYKIKERDFARKNGTDTWYLDRWRPALFYLYGNRCAKCNNEPESLQVDHCFISKAKGGNLVLIQKNRIRVNNAVPLCRECNLKKSANPCESFFTAEQLNTIYKKNAIMSEVIFHFR